MENRRRNRTGVLKAVMAGSLLLGSALVTFQSASASVTAVPGTPSGVTVIAENSSAYVRFVRPAPVPGATVTNFLVQAGPKSCVASPDQTACTVVGLHNGTRYSVTVTARTAKTQGKSSSPASVTPHAPVGSITTLTASIAGIYERFTWTAPVGEPKAVDGYQFFDVSDPTNPFTPYTDYTTCPKVPTNCLYGPGNAVATSVVLVPTIGGVPQLGFASNVITYTAIGLPTSPVAVVAIGKAGQLAVSWLPPQDLGGGKILSYRATAAPVGLAGGSSVSCSTTTAACVILGLTNGRTYRVTVVAQNAAGWSMYPSDPAISSPHTGPALRPPGKVNNISVTVDSFCTVVVTFDPPGSGGEAVDHYDLWRKQGSIWVYQGSNNDPDLGGSKGGFAQNTLLGVTADGADGQRSSMVAASVPPCPK